MIPVALLAIEPSHTVLDLCASPGSKTTQALRCKSAKQRNAKLSWSSRLAGLDTTAGRVLIA
jgi:16S rRNA C967 or C1407 C5-methylase (RsmB/RsmF family)